MLNYKMWLEVRRQQFFLLCEQIAGKDLGSEGLQLYTGQFEATFDMF